MKAKLLQNLNLEPRDYLIYKTLLKLGPASIRQIATACNVNRGTTHEVLKKLMQQNLVSHHPLGKKFCYQAEPPAKLLTIAQSKQQFLGDFITQLSQHIIPSLEELKVLSSKPTVSYYEDFTGIEKVLKDVLDTMAKAQDKEYFVFSSKPMRQYLYLYYPNFTKLRVKRGIKVKAIALGKGGDQADLAERKWLPGQADENFLSYIIIYDHKLALISLTKDELPYAVVIEEAGIVQTLRFVFMSLWGMV